MKKRFQLAIIFSLLFHLSLGLILLRLERKPFEPSERPLDLTIIDVPPEADKNSAFDKMQIVDQSEKSINDDIPENAKFLSRNNQKVAEETKASKFGRFSNSEGQGTLQNAPPPQAASPQKKATVSRAQESLTPDLKPSSVAPWDLADQKTESGLPTLEALKPKFNWNKVADQQRQPTNATDGQGAATDDYLKDLKNGNQTLLNTREFVYFSYYNRIKQQLQQYWEPKIKDKVMHLFRQGRQIASTNDKITKLRITLDRKGTLIGVAVVNQSGVEELDDAAIEAFRAAAPFPNPPAGIVESDGTIKIDWSFILES